MKIYMETKHRPRYEIDIMVKDGEINHIEENIQNAEIAL